jgi:ribonuclease P protein component
MGQGLWSLRGQPAFAAARSGARTFRHEHVVVSVSRDRTDGQPVMLGLIVPKSVGIAVVRNRFRRQIRAIVRTIPPLRGRRVVVRALPGAGTVSFAELSSVLHAAGAGT